MTKQKGYITDDHYAVVPWNKNYVIIHNNEQLTDVKTLAQAKKFIEQHRTKPQSGTVFI
jgi:hypothetical protein